LNTAAESDGSIILRAKANDGIDDSNVVTLSLTKDVVPPVITLTNPDSSPAQLKTITGSTNEGTLTMSVTTGTTCDNTLTFTSYSDMNFTSESDN
jgi:3-oxoacyl-(acyl-carrier-protein) synthase